MSEATQATAAAAGEEPDSRAARPPRARSRTASTKATSVADRQGEVEPAVETRQHQSVGDLAAGAEREQRERRRPGARRRGRARANRPP